MTLEIGRASNPQEIDVNLLKEAPYNPQDRTTNDEPLHDLGSSIKQHGVLQPLIVVEPEGDGKYEIAAGNRRWKAAKTVGKRTVPCIVISSIHTQSERRLINLTENVHRKNLTYQQEFEYVAQIMKGFGDNVTLAAEKIGFSESKVMGIMKYGTLPQHVKDAIKTPDDYKNAVALSELETEKILDTMKIARDKGFSATTVANLAETMKNNPKLTPKQAADKVVARGTKITITIDGEWNLALTEAVTRIDTTRMAYAEEALKQRLSKDGFHPDKVRKENA
jgi:ParB family transcriptional regulator, chromosome partitioning protein